MTMRKHGRYWQVSALVAGLLAEALLVSGCRASTNAGAPASGACAAFAQYQGHAHTVVKIFTSIRDQQADLLQKSWETFARCTGIAISYEGSDGFETEIVERVKDGKVPDIAFFPQPGLVASLARSHTLVPSDKQVEANVDRGWSKDWKTYGEVDGTLYAAPLDASLKSFVWYSPNFFRSHGYKIPQTWNEMLKLTKQIAADGVKPWCAGIESGAATGWTVTDWVEDVMLRQAGRQVYDQWVAHKIPFNDPHVVKALDTVGQILRNPAYVNGGYGSVKSIATTAFQEGGLPILDNHCAMHRQASFYANQWPAGTKVAEDGDVYAFYLPPINASFGRPILGAGVFVGAFTNRPEVQAVAEYLSTSDWVNSRARLGAWVSANKGLDSNLLTSPLDKLSVQLLTDPATTFRFDGSDLMPSVVGSGTFWTEMTKWIKGANTSAVLATIEASWPHP